MYKVQIQYEHFLKKLLRWTLTFDMSHISLHYVIYLKSLHFNDVVKSTLLRTEIHVLLLSTYYESFISFFLFIFQSKNYLLKLGQFHRHVGVPSDYLGVMGSIFVHAVKPYLENHNQWNEKIEDAWMELFSHIARVMRHGHIHYFSEPTGRELTSTQSVSL